MSEALLRTAVMAHKAGHLAEAERLYTSILRGQPRNFQALYFLGFLHSQTGRHDTAERLMADALAVNPSSYDAFYNRGCALQRLQRHEEAVAAFDRTIMLKPDYLDALVNRGVSLLKIQHAFEALESFDRALRLNPRDLEALANRASALFVLKRYGECERAYEALLAVAPEHPYAIGTRALARAFACDWRHLADDRAAVAATIRAGKPAIPPHGCTLVGDDPVLQLACARKWVADRCPPAAAPLAAGARYTHPKIHVAYLSADFFTHATASLIAGLVEQHDRKRFDVTGISFGPDDASPMRARLQNGFDRLIDVRGRSDSDIARLLRGMEIDIAVDLKGYTEGARPRIFALRPAPVQVNYLGHPGTMGAPYIDYILADRILIPDDQRRHYSEQVVYLPNSYQVNDDKRAIAERTLTRAEAGLPIDGFVFACFSNLYKITPATFGIWMRLLAGVAGSVLWLYEDNPEGAANLRREAHARGVSAERLVFATRVAQEEHIARQRLADLFLDTLPCTAHTTASDALWAGLPVLTALGSTFAGRVAASVVSAAGLQELVVPSLEVYERVAFALAREPARVARLKAKLARDRATHALFDTKRFTRDLETAYAGMHERHRRGWPPASFAVQP
jgi:protein O-GlcNAc transferase